MKAYINDPFRRIYVGPSPPRCALWKLKNAATMETIGVPMNYLVAIVLLFEAVSLRADSPADPVPLAIVGLAHDKAGTFLAELRSRSDAALVAIVETNQDLIAQYQRRFNLD